MVVLGWSLYGCPLLGWGSHGRSPLLDWSLHGRSSLLGWSSHDHSPLLGSVCIVAALLIRGACSLIESAVTPSIWLTETAHIHSQCTLFSYFHFSLPLLKSPIEFLTALVTFNQKCRC